MRHFFFCSLLMITSVVNAQDKELLAKAAYQNAEEAFSSGNLERALTELNKVDAVLGIYTPKSAYLRVQVWNAYAEVNNANSAGAIQVCKSYLDLHKTFPDMAEEKLIEVTNLIPKLERYAAEYDKIQAKETEEKNSERLKNQKADILIPLVIKAIDSFMLAEFKFKAGETLDSLVARRPDAASLIKDKFKKPSDRKSMWSNTDTDKIGYRDYNSKSGINTIWLGSDNRQVITYDEIIMHSNNEKSVSERFNYYRSKLSHLVAALSELHDSKLSKDWNIGYFYSNGSVAITRQYYSLKFNKAQRKVSISDLYKEVSIMFDTSPY